MLIENRFELTLEGFSGIFFDVFNTSEMLLMTANHASVGFFLFDEK
jgi:hypothetical protein